MIRDGSKSNLSKVSARAFQKKVLRFYADEKRSFQWRETTDPYAILVSEFMLQQTQTTRVVPYFERFLNEFPDFASLATGSKSKLLMLWQGLGYNRRALNLQKTASIVMEQYGGVLPAQKEELLLLPGIGAYTAQAVLTFAFNQPGILIETNIRAVYIHHFFSSDSTVHDRQLEPLIEATLFHSDPRTWYYALMDYGVFLKAQYRQIGKRSAHYVRQSKFQGSHRQVRGAIIRELTTRRQSTVTTLARVLGYDRDRIKLCINELKEEGFLVQEGRSFSLEE